MISTKDLKQNILQTNNLQRLIDEAQNDTLIISGTYITGPLFIKSNTNIIFDDNARLIATTSEEEYKDIQTRVAGIEMPWYPAILNIIDATNVVISGNGIIDGGGPYWWNKYWGEDKNGGLRKIYDAKGLRWACDYDCKRPRNLLISNSSNVILKDITSYCSGFWNVHILYSHDIHIDSIKIETIDIESPSTDGIDIDSSYNVLVENVITNCFDDSICIKSGRDADGLRVGIPAHDIIIRNSIIKKGFGITIGSEVTGGVYNINIDNIKYLGTDCGFRIKSQLSRKGYIRDINISNLEMIDVKYLFHLYLNWNASYNMCKLPDNYKGEVKPHWCKLIEEVDSSISNTIIENISITNVKATLRDDYKGISRVFNIEGFKDVPINNIVFNNCDIKAFELGIMNYTTNVKFNSCNISLIDRYDAYNDEYDNR